MSASSILVPLALGFAVGNFYVQGKYNPDGRVFYWGALALCAIADVAFIFKF